MVCKKSTPHPRPEQGRDASDKDRLDAVLRKLARLLGRASAKESVEEEDRAAKGESSEKE